MSDDHDDDDPTKKERAETFDWLAKRRTALTREEYDALKGELRLPLQYWKDLKDVRPPVDVASGLLYGGCVTTLIGESNAGKGWFTLALEAALLLGAPFPYQLVEQRHVLHLNADHDPIGPRLLALCERFPALAVAIDFGHVALQPEEPITTGSLLSSFEALARQLREDRPHFFDRPTVIVIDTLRRVMDGNENDSADVSRWFSALRRVISPTGPFPGAAVLVVHHMGWQDTGGPSRERGSSAIRDCADVSLTLTNERQAKAHADEAKRRLNPYASLAEPPPLGRRLLTLAIRKNKHAAFDPQQTRQYTFVLEHQTVGYQGAYYDSMVLLPAPEGMTQAAIDATAAAERQDADDAAVLGAIQMGLSAQKGIALALNLPLGRVQLAVGRLVLARLVDALGGNRGLRLATPQLEAPADEDEDHGD